MKRFLLLLLFAIATALQGYAQQIPVDFDERVDLMSVVFHLAGNKEYNRCAMTDYTNEMDQYFSAFKDHKVVELAREYAQISVSYDAVASYALHLKMPASPQTDFTIDDQFQEGVDESFERWSDSQKQEFLAPLSDFYRQSNFHQWYERSASLREKAIKIFEENINQNIDWKWFDQFFGKREGSSFNIVLSFLVWPNNYGCSTPLKNGDVHISPVIGCPDPSEKNNRAYIQTYLPIVIHECCHSYCNPLISQYWKQMESKSAKVYAEKADVMERMAYGHPTYMMNETFVRSCVIRYVADHNRNANLDELINNESEFILTRTMVESLGTYQTQRSKYADINSYMPQLVKDINHFSLRKYKKAQIDYRKKCAKIVSCSIKNGDKNYPSGKSTLIITFDKPMQPGVALGFSDSGGEFLNLDGSVRDAVSWSDDQKTITIKLDLKANTHYAFSIMGEKFLTQDGHNAGETQYIDFWTKE